MSDLEQLRYPIGRFKRPDSLARQDIDKWIEQIETLPVRFRKVADALSDEQLNTPYRPEGWTLRQVIHHVPDSHVNSYIRFKWTLTEKQPTIKAYDEVAWAAQPDYQFVPVGLSLDFLEVLHARWVPILKSLTDSELKRSFIHPEHGKEVPLGINVALYAWHGDHHLGHLEQTIKIKGW